MNTMRTISDSDCNNSNMMCQSESEDISHDKKKSHSLKRGKINA
jgi:hypothetical protein